MTMIPPDLERAIYETLMKVGDKLVAEYLCHARAAREA